MLLLIDNYDSFTYNLYQYLCELGATVEVFRNDKIGLEEIDAMAPERLVISPGPCTPKEAGISVECVRRFGGHLPILGVCLGHQAIGQAYGGRIVRAPTLMHGKLSTVHNTGAGIFAGLPSEFEATRYHSLTVKRDTCPDCFEITAETDDGVIMGLQHKTHALHGVQFHPESIATATGHERLANCIELATGTPVEGYGTESRAGEMVAL